MDDEWTNASVAELQQKGILFVEDGNHGEYRPLADEFAESGTPFIRPDDLKDGRVDFAKCDRINEIALGRIRKGKGRPGDIVFTHRATVGRIARIGLNDPSFVANPGVTVWRSNRPDVLDPVYLYFYMQTSAFMDQVWAEAGNTDTFPYVSLTQQRSLKVSMPSSIARQRAIARILGTLDDKIELNRRTNETLEAMARAIFKSWFVDFDPVRAKAEGRDPGLPKHIADLFPDRLEDSELGEIPVGWEAGKVENFATLNRISINPGDFSDETFEHFSIPAFDEGQTPKRELGATIKSNKFLIPPNAILLSKLNPRIPRLWLPVVRDNTRAICSTEFLVVLPRINAFREFIYGLLSSEAFADVFETLVTGTSGSHQRVRPEGLLSMNVVIPEKSIIHDFSRIVQPLLTRVGRTRAESQTIAALRDKLLPKLISGELRVKDAESCLESHA